jgi:hypothetical protein
MRSFVTCTLHHRVIKARRMGWAELVVRMEEMRNTKFWSENLRARDHSVYLGVDGRITLEWTMEIG